MNYNYKSILLLCSLYIFFNSCSDLFLSEIDECGIPGGDSSSCLDECGIPNGAGIPIGECDCNNNIMGCNGVCGSKHVLDICGVCNGLATDSFNCGCKNNQDLKDCLGECGGAAFVDACGVCNGDNLSCTGCMITGSDNYSTINIVENNQACFVNFSSIKTIFNNHCISCHGSSGGVKLESYSDIINSNIIQNSDSTNSLLWQVIKGSNPSMPPGDPISSADVHKISLWIHFGAVEEN